MIASSGVGGTLGRTSVGAAAAGGGSGFIAVSGPYNQASATTVTKLTGYLQGSASAAPLRAVIYADNGSGAPGLLVAVSQQTTLAANQPAGWVDFNFTTAPNLPAGNYWLGYWFGGSATVYYDNVAASGRYTPASYSSTADPPPSFGAGTPDSIGLSLYATTG